MRSFTLSATDSIDDATERIVEAGLDSFNEARVGPDTSHVAWVIARDDAGSVVAGLKAVSIWTWFLIDWLWVHETARGLGLGSKLMKTAEDVARARGCKDAFLSTFSFQAADFYRKLGYREFGRLDDFPEGHSRHWFRKTLVG